MKLFKHIALVCCILYTRQSFACSYFVDEIAKKNEIGSQVLSALQIELTDFAARVKSYKVDNFSFFESKSTPMCPEEMTYSMEVNIQYVPARGGAYCFYNSKVSLIEGWGKNTYRNFVFETPAEDAICYHMGALD